MKPLGDPILARAEEFLIHRSLFATLRNALGFAFLLKAVRQLRRGFPHDDCVRFPLLQRTVRLSLRWSEHLGPAVFGLTPCEGDVLRWVERGKTDPEISILPDIGPRTVRAHVAGLLCKLIRRRRGARWFWLRGSVGFGRGLGRFPRTNRWVFRSGEG